MLHLQLRMTTIWSITNILVFAPVIFHSFSEEIPDKLMITYDNAVLNKIVPGVLLAVAGNLSHVILNCESKAMPSAFFKWVYHGIQEKEMKLMYYQNMILLANFHSGPPVIRMECTDTSENKMSSNALIYRGDDRPPFLYNNGKMIDATNVNSTTIQLPCLLKYPINHTDQFQLILLKDGHKIDKMEGVVSYTPEYGFILKWTKLANPFGKFECIVANSTSDDFVIVEFSHDNSIREDIQVKHPFGITTFFEGDPAERTFWCSVSKRKFQSKFEWYLLQNGSYIPIRTTASNSKDRQDPLRYSSRVKFNFPSRFISHVVCAAFLKDNGNRYNNTYAVNINVPVKPEIVPVTLIDNHPIIYQQGMSLTCKSFGEPINIYWLKNGAFVTDLSMSVTYTKEIKISTLHLNPSVDDTVSNYTCIAKNFMGQDSITFQVNLKNQDELEEEIKAKLIKKMTDVEVEEICGSADYESNSSSFEMNSVVSSSTGQRIKREPFKKEKTRNNIREITR